LELAAELGGLAGGIFALMAFFCTEITFMLIVDKFVKLFYTNREGIFSLNSDKLIPTEDELDTYNTIGKDFTIWEIMYRIWWLKPFLCCFRNSKCMRNHQHFYNYYNMIINELNFFKVYSKINKIEKNQAHIEGNQENIDINLAKIRKNDGRILQLENNLGELF